MSLSSWLADLGLTRFTSIHHWDAHPLVGLSSLCFGFPAASYAAVAWAMWDTKTKVDSYQLALYALLAFLFVGVVLMCYLADYCFIKRGHRSAYGRFDIRLASLTFVVCVFDFALRGLSSAFHQWVFRHCAWHGVAGAIGTYAAWRCRPSGPPDRHCRERRFAKLSVHRLGSWRGWQKASLASRRQTCSMDHP